MRAHFDRVGHEIGAGTSTPKGKYKFDIRIPRRASIGTHTVIVRTKGRQYETTIEVVEDQDTPRGASFATTPPMLMAWVALIAVVLAFFVGSRRRKRAVAMARAPSSGVPMIDTSSFVPIVRSKTARTRAKPKSAKPASSRKNTQPKKDRSSANKKASKPSTAARSTAKRKPVAKKRGTATTKRSEPKAPRRRVQGAKPTKRRRPSGSGPQD